MDQFLVIKIDASHITWNLHVPLIGNHYSGPAVPKLFGCFAKNEHV